MLNIEQYSQGFTIKASDEEKVWLEKINRYPLWYRYAPKNIKDNDLILFAYEMSIRLKSCTYSLIYGKKA